MKPFLKKAFWAILGTPGTPIYKFHILQYITLVLHISLCAVDFKLLLFLNVNLLYLKYVLLFIT